MMLTKEPAKAQHFMTKGEAAEAAKSIGWYSRDATKVEVMGFELWTICTDHMSYLTPLGYRQEREKRGIQV